MLIASFMMSLSCSEIIQSSRYPLLFLMLLLRTFLTFRHICIGNKRKLSQAQLQAAANNNIYQLFCGGGDPSNENDLDRVIDSVSSGTNKELLKRSETLLRY